MTIIIMPGAESVLTREDIEAIASGRSDNETVVVSAPVSDSGAGYTKRDTAEMWADAVIDTMRFESEEDRILGRYEAGLDLFPAADQLAAMGVDTVKLALALDAGVVKPHNVLMVLPGFMKS